MTSREPACLQGGKEKDVTVPTNTRWRQPVTSRGSYSATWRTLVRAVSATRVVPIAPFITAGLAIASHRSSVGARSRHLGTVSAIDEHALSTSDAQDLARLDSDKG